MSCRTLLTGMAILLPLVIACGNDTPLAPTIDALALRGGPANGNGNKEVIPLNTATTLVACPGKNVVLSRRGEGWVQIRTFDQAGNRNVRLEVFHQTITFTNPDGDTFVFRDVGPDHYYLDESGHLIVTITGRSTGSGVIGHVVINLDTGEVLLEAGQEFGTARDLACAALT